MGWASQNLKTGDVLLQSVPCYVCALIELEEGSPYSHVGVVLREQNKVSVLESWSKVEKLSLATHLSYRKKNTRTLVLRPLDVWGRELKLNSEHVNNVFKTKYLGLDYDPGFLWNNENNHGQMLYCSEFAAKFLNEFLPRPILPKPMHFNSYREDWKKYFHGTPPDGAPGISPSDFPKSRLFKVVGEI